jgi:hypothetical protein
VSHGRGDSLLCRAQGLQLSVALKDKDLKMSLVRTKQNLLDILADSKNRVVALSGKWGTGKSHLWKEVQGASSDPQVKAAVYVSLFGLSSLSELRLKVAQGVLPKLEAGG